MSAPSGRILVTGASSGIGFATAVALAERAGSDVELLLQGRDPDRLGAVADRVRATGAAASVHAVELTDDAAVAAFAAAVPRPLAGVVHSAGVATLAPFADAEIADFDRQWAVNVRAPYLLTQHLLPAFGPGAQVVFVNSGAGLRARAGWSQYAATKHALRAIADGLRGDLEGAGIRVVSVYPGRVATPMQRAVRAMEDAEYREEDYARPEDVAAQIVAALSLPPRAVVTDVSVRPA